MTGGNEEGERAGVQAAGGINADATAAAAAPRVPAFAPRPARCLCANCATERVPGARFCHGCGQSARERTPTVAQMVRDYGHQYVGLEGAFWHTLKLLLLRPGRLTLEYLRGRRRRFVHPIRLYLTVSILCFLTLQLVALRMDFGAIERTAKPVSSVRIDLGVGNAQIKGEQFECNMGQWICERLKRRYAVEPRQLALELQSMSRRFIGYFPYAMFVLLPLFALLLQLVYLNRRLHYAEHLVFALHLHAFWFLAVIGIALLPAALSAWLFLAMPLYALLAMRTAYGGRWRATLARALVISPLYAAALFAMMGAVAVTALLG